MNWNKFFLFFLRNVLLSLAFAIGILGLIGFLVAGPVGLANGATWGLILGLVSVPFSAFIFLPKFWGDYAGRYSQWWVKKETVGEVKKDHDI